MKKKEDTRKASLRKAQATPSSQQNVFENKQQQDKPSPIKNEGSFHIQRQQKQVIQQKTGEYSNLENLHMRSPCKTNRKQVDNIVTEPLQSSLNNSPISMNFGNNRLTTQEQDNSARFGIQIQPIKQKSEAFESPQEQPTNTQSDKIDSTNQSQVLISKVQGGQSGQPTVSNFGQVQASIRKIRNQTPGQESFGSSPLLRKRTPSENTPKKDLHSPGFRAQGLKLGSTVLQQKQDTIQDVCLTTAGLERVQRRSPVAKTSSNRMVVERGSKYSKRTTIKDSEKIKIDEGSKKSQFQPLGFGGQQIDLKKTVQPLVQELKVQSPQLERKDSFRDPLMSFNITTQPGLSNYDQNVKNQGLLISNYQSNRQSFHESDSGKEGTPVKFAAKMYTLGPNAINFLESSADRTEQNSDGTKKEARGSTGAASPLAILPKKRIVQSNARPRQYLKSPGNAADNRKKYLKKRKHNRQEPKHDGVTNMLSVFDIRNSFKSGNEQNLRTAGTSNGLNSLYERSRGNKPSMVSDLPNQTQGAMTERRTYAGGFGGAGFVYGHHNFCPTARNRQREKFFKPEDKNVRNSLVQTNDNLSLTGKRAHFNNILSLENTEYLQRQFLPNDQRWKELKSLYSPEDRARMAIASAEMPRPRDFLASQKRDIAGIYSSQPGQIVNHFNNDKPSRSPVPLNEEQFQALKDALPQSANNSSNAFSSKPILKSQTISKRPTGLRANRIGHSIIDERRHTGLVDANIQNSSFSVTRSQPGLPKLNNSHVSRSRHGVSSNRQAIFSAYKTKDEFNRILSQDPKLGTLHSKKISQSFIGSVLTESRVLKQPRNRDGSRKSNMQQKQFVAEDVIPSSKAVSSSDKINSSILQRHQGVDTQKAESSQKSPDEKLNSTKMICTSPLSKKTNNSALVGEVMTSHDKVKAGAGEIEPNTKTNSAETISRLDADRHSQPVNTSGHLQVTRVASQKESSNQISKIDITVNKETSTSQNRDHSILSDIKMSNNDPAETLKSATPVDGALGTTKLTIDLPQESGAFDQESEVQVEPQAQALKNDSQVTVRKTQSSHSNAAMTFAKPMQDPASRGIISDQSTEQQLRVHTHEEIIEAKHSIAIDQSGMPINSLEDCGSSLTNKTVLNAQYALQGSAKYSGMISHIRQIESQETGRAVTIPVSVSSVDSPLKQKYNQDTKISSLREPRFAKKPAKVPNVPAMPQYLAFAANSTAASQINEDQERKRFVSQKAYEFMRVQEQLSLLEYNDDDDDHKALKKANQIIRQVDQNRMNSLNEDDPLAERSIDVATYLETHRRKEVQFAVAPPRSLIDFKNKSEEERYNRLATRIVTLSTQTQDQMDYSYHRIFKFLADILTVEEFENLTFYHINMLIRKITSTVRNLQDKDVKSNGSLDSPKSPSSPKSLTSTGLKPVSLRAFIYQALDLRYQASNLSQQALDKIFEMHQAPSIWHGCGNIDIGQKFDLKKIRSMQPMPTDPEKKNAVLCDHIVKNTSSKNHETELPVILNTKYFKEKEKVSVPVTTRLMKKTGQTDTHFRTLREESKMRRNKLLLEHVVEQRNRKEWEQGILEEIQEELRAVRKQIIENETQRTFDRTPTRDQSRATTNDMNHIVGESRELIAVMDNLAYQEQMSRDLQAFGPAASQPDQERQFSDPTPIGVRRQITSVGIPGPKARNSSKIRLSSGVGSDLISENDKVVTEELDSKMTRTTHLVPREVGKGGKITEETDNEIH